MLTRRPIAARLAVALLLGAAAGCGSHTGVILAVQGPQGISSVQMGVARLEFVAARESWCARWVADQATSGTKADVTGRDLETKPYELWVQPAQMTDLSQPVRFLALAYDGGGALLGAADFGAHPYEYKAVDRYEARIVPFARTGEGAPKYRADDGCLCAPGLPWIGNGTGQGCDQAVVTSAARLADTAGCELAPGRTELTEPLCDGQDYGDRADRALPCYAVVNGACRAGVRTCHDRDGVAFNDECVPDASAPALPTTALCDAYAQCEAQACGDPNACLRANVARGADIHCVLRVNAEGTSVQMCGATKADLGLNLTGTACTASLPSGRTNGVLVYSVGGNNGVASSSCQPSLTVSTVLVPPSRLPSETTVLVSLGGELRNLIIAIESSCPSSTSGEPFFKCSL